MSVSAEIHVFVLCMQLLVAYFCVREMCKCFVSVYLCVCFVNMCEFSFRPVCEYRCLFECEHVFVCVCMCVSS